MVECPDRLDGSTARRRSQRTAGRVRGTTLVCRRGGPWRLGRRSRARPLNAGFSELLRGGFVYRGEVRRGCSLTARSVGTIPYFLGERGRRQVRFEGKRVVEEPFSRAGDIESGLRLGPLRGMDVKVDQARQQSLGRRQSLRSFGVLNRCNRRRRVGRVRAGDDTVAVHHDGNIAQNLQNSGTWESERGSGKHEGGGGGGVNQGQRSPRDVAARPLFNP